MAAVVRSWRQLIAILKMLLLTNFVSGTKPRAWEFFQVRHGPTLALGFDGILHDTWRMDFFSQIKKNVTQMLSLSDCPPHPLFGRLRLVGEEGSGQLWDGFGIASRQGPDGFDSSSRSVREGACARPPRLVSTRHYRLSGYGCQAVL